MTKEIKQIITINGEKVWRITTPDSRFYGKEIKDQKTGLPVFEWLPSVSWIKSYYYKSPYLIKWIAERGISEADAIKQEAGKQGDRIHQACEDIDKGEEVKIDAKYLNKETGILEELNAEELTAIKSFVDYLNDNKPELIANEMTVLSKTYAGTLDRIIAQGEVKKGVRQIYIVDLKTSKSIYTDMIIQLSAYSHADIDYKALKITDEEWKNRKLLILQLGYLLNKKKYKATEVEDRYDLFEIAYKIWQEENKDIQPKQRDFPLVLKAQCREKNNDKPNDQSLSQKPNNNNRRRPATINAGA